MNNRLSFTTLACPDWDIVRIVAAAVDNGYAAIDFRGYLGSTEIIEDPHFRGDSLRDIAARVRDAGLVVSCLSSGAKMSVPDAAARGRELDVMRRYAELCGAFGCRQVRIFGGSVEDIADPVSNAAETLVSAADIARDAGIAFVVETHDDWTSSAQLRAAFDAAERPDGIGLLWDVHHPWRVHGESPEESVRNLSVRLLNTHWKDSVSLPGGGRQLCLPGDGEVPLPAMLAALRAIGYDGWLTLEWEKKWHPEIEPPEIAIPRFADFMRNA